MCKVGHACTLKNACPVTVTLSEVHHLSYMFMVFVYIYLCVCVVTMCVQRDMVQPIGVSIAVARSFGSTREVTTFWEEQMLHWKVDSVVGEQLLLEFFFVIFPATSEDVTCILHADS